MVNQDVNRLPFRGIFRDVTWILESHAFIIVFHEFLLSFLFIPFLRIWHSISRNQPTVCHSLRSPTLGSHVIVYRIILWVQPPVKELPTFPFLGFYSWDVTDRHKMNSFSKSFSLLTYFQDSSDDEIMLNKELKDFQTLDVNSCVFGKWCPKR